MTKDMVVLAEISLVGFVHEADIDSTGRSFFRSISLAILGEQKSEGLQGTYLSRRVIELRNVSATIVLSPCSL